MDKVKILYIIPSLRICNGVASYVMNYFRNINHSKFQIDFIILADERSEYFDEIEKNGGKITYISKINIKNYFKVIKQIKEFFINNKYDIVHCHVLNMGAFYLYYANKYGVKQRILHSHATKYADKKINAFRNSILSRFSIKNANTYFACSKLAGDFLFKKKKYFIINNAIDEEKFRFNEETRNKIRKQYNIKSNQLVLGHVGRFVEQKNHLFLLNIYKEIKLLKGDAVLLLIGEGPLQNVIKQKVKNENIDNVIFTNNVSNVNDYMQAMDIFVLPSLFEGLPIVGIEAQASGLPVVFADTITEEAKITNYCTFLPIKKHDISKWKKFILNLPYNINRNNQQRNIRENNYDIYTESVKMEEIYINLKNQKKTII